MTGTLGPGLGYGRAARFMYIATASQTTFSGPDSSTEALTLSYTPNFVEVAVNGLWLPPTDYTASNGSSVVFASGLTAGDIVYVYVLSVLAIADAISFAGVQSLTATQKAQARANTGVLCTPQGRLTLQTAVPVMVATQSAKTTIYYTPYVGNHIPIYDGANTTPKVFSELSIATTDTAKSPAAIGASKVNDWFVWEDAGVMRLIHGPDWTSDTARSAGTALVMVNGILLNSVAITNGPAASRGTYVGTTRSNASSQLDWIIGTAAVGGGAAFFYVWNTYNRVSVTASVTDNTGSWTYGTNAWRATNASASNRVSFVSGLPEEGSIAFNFANGRPAASVISWGEAGVVLDSTTGASVTGRVLNPTAGTYDSGTTATLAVAPQTGAHYVQAVELGDGATNVTWFGSTKQVFTFSSRM